MWRKFLLLWLLVSVFLITGCNLIPASPAFDSDMAVKETPADQETETPKGKMDKETALKKVDEFLEKKVSNNNDGFQLWRVSEEGSLTEKPQYFIRYKRVYHNIPIYGGEVLVIVDANTGEIVDSTGAYKTTDVNVSFPDLSPAIDPEKAMKIAGDVIGVKDQFKKKEGQDAELILYSVPTTWNRAYVLAWQFKIETDCPPGDWFVIVNAWDGTVLHYIDEAEWFVPKESKCPTPPLPPTLTPAPAELFPTLTPAAALNAMTESYPEPSPYP